MDKYDINLESYIIDNSINIEKNIFILLEIAIGILYLHQNNIIHRDLKPENIFLSIDKKNKIKKVCLSDLGISRIIHDGITKLTTDGKKHLIMQLLN